MTRTENLSTRRGPIAQPIEALATLDLIMTCMSKKIASALGLNATKAFMHQI